MTIAKNYPLPISVEYPQDFMSNKPSSVPIMVYLGANAHMQLEQELLAFNPGIRFVESAVYPERMQPTDTDAQLGNAAIRFDADLRGSEGDILFTPIVGCNQIAIIESVMDDKLLPLLWTRFGGRTRWRHLSEVKRYEVAYSLAKSAIDTCRKFRPQAVVFSCEPHMLPMYIFKKVCKAMGIQTSTMAVSPFNWRVFLELENIYETTSPLTRSTAIKADPLHDSVAKFISEKKSDYSVAKPFYEKRIERLGMGKRLLYKLKANGWKPYKVILGHLAFADYRCLTTPRSQLQGLRYVCVFLQLQPEQTTLPDGEIFVHHLFAIQTLYAAVSRLGLKLVIREHPATFETGYSLTWRPRDFYRTVKNIGPGIFFDRIDADPYTLIKNAVAVSAITGTVLLEALLQGRPAIAFSKHPLRGYLNAALVDCFSDEQELKEKLEAALVQPAESICAEVESYLHRVYPDTFGPDDYVGNAKMSLDLLRQSRYEALRQIIKGMTMAQAPASLGEMPEVTKMTQ